MVPTFYHIWGLLREAPCPTLPTFCRKETPRGQHSGKIIPSSLGTVRGETVDIRVWWWWYCWGLADQCGSSPRTWFHPDLTFSWASWWLCLVFHFLILIVRIIKMPTSEGSCEAEMKWNDGFESDTDPRGHRQFLIFSLPLIAGLLWALSLWFRWAHKHWAEHSGRLSLVPCPFPCRLKVFWITRVRGWGDVSVGKVPSA